MQGVHIPVLQAYMDVVQTTSQQQEATMERGVRLAVSCPDLAVVLIAIFQPLDPITQVVHTHVKPVCMGVVQTITQQQLVQMEKVVLTHVINIPMDVVRTTELQLMDLNMMVVLMETLNQV